MATDRNCVCDDDDDMTIMMSVDVISDYDLSGAVFADRPLFHPQCSLSSSMRWPYLIFAILFTPTKFLGLNVYT